MSYPETFSQRQARLAKAGQVDVYQYEDLSLAFRHQVVHILADVVPPDPNADSRVEDDRYLGYEEYNRTWETIINIFSHARGYSRFGFTTNKMSPFDVCNYLITKYDAGVVIDFLEIAFNFVHTAIRPIEYQLKNQSVIAILADDAIAELNFRFKQHGIGYEFVNGEIIRIDSQYIHSEAVKPALALLSEPGFETVNTEFMQAHTHYRDGKYQDALVWALKAFESTMKVIYTARQWAFGAHDTAAKLIAVAFQESLIPPDLQSQFTSLRAVLESGIPTVRNRTSGHGQGTTPVAVPGYLAAYGLHLTAANIVLLVEAHKAKT